MFLPISAARRAPSPFPTATADHVRSITAARHPGEARRTPMFPSAMAGQLYSLLVIFCHVLRVVLCLGILQCIGAPGSCTVVFSLTPCQSQHRISEHPSCCLAPFLTRGKKNLCSRTQSAGPDRHFQQVAPRNDSAYYAKQYSILPSSSRSPPPPAQSVSRAKQAEFELVSVKQVAAPTEISTSKPRSWGMPVTWA